MNRHYSLNDYEKAILMAREAIPNVAITTDILVGFPGENEKEFEESCRFCEKIGFANIHVFPYSPRPDTSALKMAHPVTERIKKERSQKMREIAQESRRKFRRQFLGQTVTILWESEIERGFWSGLTPNYLRVFTKSEQPMTNCLRPVKLIAEKAQGLLGEPTDGGENG
jgi:threonylcarbamoyladenosine tRNA methylthiotransferase MtaB